LQVTFWFIVESTLVNSWILSRELANLELEYTHFDFRVAIARALAREWEDRGCVFQRGNVVSSLESMLKRGVAHRVRLSFVTKVFRSTRDFHLPFYEKIPLMEEG
jgi:hypothetical protein